MANNPGLTDQWVTQWLAWCVPGFLVTAGQNKNGSQHSQKRRSELKGQLPMSMHAGAVANVNALLQGLNTSFPVKSMMDNEKGRHISNSFSSLPIPSGNTETLLH
jgi:hypothetical protein